jgi:hypothetical protein
MYESLFRHGCRHIGNARQAGKLERSLWCLLQRRSGTALRGNAFVGRVKHFDLPSSADASDGACSKQKKTGTTSGDGTNAPSFKNVHLAG